MTTLPALISVTGILKGNGTVVAAAVSGTDYQAAGNYITALTGDGTASGPGSVGLTLATVNTNTGAIGSSTAIPTITTNGKGLVTAVTTNAVIAPAGTLSGTTLNSTVVGSSLTSVGTIATGTWNGTVVAGQYGGTGVANTGKTITLGGNLTTSGAFATTLTATATTSVTLPTSGTLYGTASGSITSSQLATSLTDETGTGSNVFGTTPTLNQPLIVGITSGSAIAAGNVGEVISSYIAKASQISTASATATNVTSISLTAGTWDLYGMCAIVTKTGVTTGLLYATLGSTSATINTDTLGCSAWLGNFAGDNSSVLVINPTLNINISTTTTYYLVGQHSSTGSVGLYGGLWARRRA